MEQLLKRYRIMRHKFRLLIVIPALLLILGYLAAQFFLRKPAGIEKNKFSKGAIKTDTLGNKKTTVLDLRPLLINKMKQLVSKSSKGLYSFSADDLELDVLTSRLIFRGVTLLPNKEAEHTLRAGGALPETIVTLKLNSLQVEGINLDDALTSKTMDYQLIRLVRPQLTLRQTGVSGSKKEGDFSERFLQEMRQLKIERLFVEDATVRVQQPGKADKVFERVRIDLGGILLDSTTRNDKSRFLFASSAGIHIKGYSSQSTDGIYNLEIGTVQINPIAGRIEVADLSYQTSLTRNEFKKRKGSAEMISLKLPALSVQGMNWWDALNNSSISAKKLVTKNGSVSVFFDRSAPPRSRMGNFPSQALMKLKGNLAINEALLQNMDIAYEEFNPISQKVGKLTLNNTEVNISNITNKKGSGKIVSVSISGQLMNRIMTKATFRFNLNKYNSGAFTAQLNTGAFDAALLNPVMMPLGMVEAEKGSVQSLTANMSGTEKSAAGEVLFLYRDVKLAILEKEKDKSLDKKNVLSALANLLVIKKSNTKEKGLPGTESAVFVRNPNAGFMNLVWKTTLVGILKTMRVPEKKAKGG